MSKRKYREVEDPVPLKFRGMINGEWAEVTPDDHAWGQFWQIVDRKTVGQYIGVVDADTEEMFEGDIVAYDNASGRQPIGVITRFCAGWIIKGAESIPLTTSGALITAVGNIHQHEIYQLGKDKWIRNKEQ